jgi:dihydrofolate synthase / folylpolyglutamate synthase
MGPFTLQAITSVLHRLGNPHQAGYRVVHVAGTNGKGSVCALIEAALRASGQTTGLTISPHLVHSTERIQLNGQPVSTAVWQTAQIAVQAADPDHTLSYFEQCMAMAFWVFAQNKVDWVILETGVGGRLDASNVVTAPALAVITSIGLDHMALLGDTLEAIATEKAGIIKPHCPVVLGPGLTLTVSAVFARIAQALEAPVVTVPLGAVLWHPEPLGGKGDTLALPHYIETATGQALPCPLLGIHQADNVATAWTALHALAQQGHKCGNPDLWRQGFAGVQWPGRCQVWPNRRWVIDGSHNPPGMQTLRHTLDAVLPPTSEPMGLVLSLKADRDPATVLPVLLTGRVWGPVWVMPGPADSGLSFHTSAELALHVKAYLPARAEVLVVNALPIALAQLTQWQQQYIHQQPMPWGLVTGSLYSVGAVLAAYTDKN